MQRPIYLDHHATTPLDPQVLDAMMPYLTQEFGNASSTEHRFGWVAEEAVSKARESIASGIGAASPSEIVFTSGSTESNNLALWGIIEAYARKGNHIITAATEHKAILDPLNAWQRKGGKVTVLPVDTYGRVDPKQVEAAICDATILVTVMAANNEIGVIQPIAEIGAIAEKAGILFHTDATQAVGKIPFNVTAMHVHTMAFSGHKIYGPKGVGALYVRRRNPRVTLRPHNFGGGHERGLRPGTLNVPGIVGLAAALKLSLDVMPTEARRLLALRQRLLQGLQAQFPGLLLNGHPQQRLPGNLNVAFPNLRIENLVREIYGEIAVSTGAACTSANPEPSHVLAALDKGDARASSSIRFGLGRGTTEDEIDAVIERFTRAEALAPYRSN